MKPRLKLSANGTLTLLTEGVTGLSRHQTRQLIWKHHGSILTFAKRFSLPYDLVCIATGCANATSTGQRITTVRGLLGLPTQPRKRTSSRQLRASKTPPGEACADYVGRPTKASAPEAPEAQSASAKTGTAGTRTGART